MKNEAMAPPIADRISITFFHIVFFLLPLLMFLISRAPYTNLPELPSAGAPAGGRLVVGHAPGKLPFYTINHDHSLRLFSFMCGLFCFRQQSQHRPACSQQIQLYHANNYSDMHPCIFRSNIQDNHRPALRS